MKTVVCVRCDQEVELEDDDFPICDPCLRERTWEVLEELGQPIVWDEEKGVAYVPQGARN